MWCDDFDMDLKRIVPAAVAIADRVPASVVLRTFGHVTDGALNHPAVWNSAHGMTAYFTLGSGRPAPLHCVTFDPIVECTFTEAIRDCWCHDYRLVVDSFEVWDGVQVFQRWMQPLMYHHRGWMLLHERAVVRLEQQVCTSIAGATARLLRLLDRRGELAARN